MAARTYLFVPADRPERYSKALAAGADAVIVDLEDAVAPPAKSQARDALAEWLASAGAAPVVVRINGADSAWFTDDLALLRHPNVAAVMLPKAESAAAVGAIAARHQGLTVLPLIESAAGLAQARALAAAPAVVRLAFGSIDFQIDLGLRDAEEDDLLPWRAEIVLASRLAGIEAPIDGVTVALDDAARLQADTLRARRLGFGAKLCIHPKQVAVVQAAFAPSAAECAWAQRVLEAAARSGGAAVALDGKMVDKPVILRAEAILREAAATGPSG